MNRVAASYCWEHLEVDHPMDQIDRRRIVGEHCMISHVTLHKGFKVAPHRHENEQIAVVLTGRIRFRLPNDHGDESTTELGAGDVMHLPQNVPHGAEALEDTLILDIFSPPSDRTGVDANQDQAIDL